MKPSPPKAKPKAKPARTTFFATLLGRNEIGKDGKRRAGDLDGQGGATVVTTDTQLCFAVAVRGISTPNAMHVHRGRPNENGGIVVALDPPTSGDPGASAGCVNVASTLLQEITKHPIRFYVNIHTSDFPTVRCAASCTALPGGADLTGAGRAAAGAGRSPRGPLRGSTGMSPAGGQVFVHHPGITVTA